jgi:RNA polymerase sigma-70 factor (ECF subfamily)
MDGTRLATSVSRLFVHATKARRRILGYESSNAVELQRTDVLPTSMTDAELNRLFASCLPQLRRATRHMLRNPDDSEDALQDGLLLALRHLNQFQGRSKFSTWLYTIVKNAARGNFRKLKCRPQVPLEKHFEEAESALGGSIQDRLPSPDEACVLKERSNILSDAMRELSPIHSAAMRLCDIEGVDSRDAAHRLGITTSALKTCLFRARRRVARRIRQTYVLPSEQFSTHLRLRLQKVGNSRSRDHSI